MKKLSLRLPSGPLILFVTGLLAASIQLQRNADAAVFKVVIDPGHGGADEGTVYSSGRTRIAEKTVTLQLSRQIANLLRSQGVSVTLTRNEDREVPLPERTALANRLKADVFISIHINSTDKGKQNQEHLDAAEGVETFILNHTTDASSKRLAHLENSVFSELNVKNYGKDSHTPTSVPMDVALILKDLRLDANLSESKRLACTIQKNLVLSALRPSDPIHSRELTFTKGSKNAAKKRDRGVKQALFHVLLGADMPSVLVEPGFLSSARDRTWILSAQGRFKVSHAIAQAIEQFRRHQTATYGALSLSKCKVN